MMMNNLGMNEEELELFKQKAEEEFFKKVENGEDIRPFLYFPYDMLSDKIKTYLDEFLLLEAYKGIEKDSEEFQKNFIVYEDSFIQLAIDEDKRVDLLQKMKNYFIEKELFENCIKIQEMLDKIII